MTKMLDRVGRDIEIGDFIVYAGMYGQTVCLNFGKVLSFPVRTDYNGNAKVKMQVQPWDVEAGTPILEKVYVRGEGYTDNYRPVRKVTLEFSDRVAVIKNF